MLEMVQARRFDRKMKVGRTGPCLMAAERKDGSEVEVVVKFSAGCDLKTDSLAIEAVSAMLAADLDLPVPESFLVGFDAAFVSFLAENSRDIATRIRASSPVAFGSEKLPPGFTVVPPGKAVSRDLLSQAADIFAFDALIENPDRRPQNPNCLYNGRSYAIIDHEAAFQVRMFIGWKPTWVPGALEQIKGNHLFYSALLGKKPDFKRFTGAWKSISDERISEYRAMLPRDWLPGNGIIEDALGHIASIRDNIDAAMAEVSRVLI